MNFREIYYGESSGDVLLIQPNMLQQILPENIDPVQTDYWDTCSNVGSLFGDLPIEPNWGLLSIAANLIKNGYSVEHIDFHLYDYIKVKKENAFITSEDIEKILLNKNYKVIGISAMTISHDNALNIAEICKRLNPNCKVILGGIHFSFLPEEGLKCESIDAVLRGEGEMSFVQLLDVLNAEEDWDKVEGIAFRKDSGYVINEPAIVDNLDLLPIPAYGLCPSDIPLIPRIYTARGCNGGCDYCVVNQFFCGTYRKRSILNIFNEIIYAVEKLHCKDILIGDLNLGASKDDAVKLCEMIIGNNLNIKWWCQTRADGLDEELIKIMSEAGCVQIGIGIESADEEILNNSTSQKNNVYLSTKELCDVIHKYNMEVQGYFIIGLPGETMDSAIMTIKTIDDLTLRKYVDITHIAVLVPYPGTPIFERTEEYDIKILSQKYSKYIMNCDYMNTGLPVVETKELSQFQIYSLWQLAISTAANNFKKRRKKDTLSMFNSVDEFWKLISIS